MHKAIVEFFVFGCFIKGLRSLLLIGFEISCFGFFKVDSFVCELLERFVEVCFVFVVRRTLEIVCRLHQNKER